MKSYDVTTNGNNRNDNNQVEAAADRDDANGSNVNLKDEDARPPPSELCVSFDMIREFVLSHAFSFCNNDGEVDSGGATLDVVHPILCARPNLNPMVALRRRRRKRGQGGGWTTATTATGVRHRSFMMAPNVTCLYPARGNVKILLSALTKRPPYNKENGRECMYYERRAISKENNGGDGKRQQTLIRSCPLTIDWPDNSDCPGGSYGPFGSDR